MPNPSPHNIQMPFSMKHARSSGFFNPRAIALLAPILTRDYYYFKDDFDNLAIASNTYWATATTGAGGAAPVLNVQPGGAARFTTGGGNPGVSTLYGAAAIHATDDNPFFHVRFKWPAAKTTFVAEFGLTSVLTTKTTVGVSDVDTPAVANGVVDAVILVMDSSQTLTTPALVGVGTSTAVAKTNVTDRAGTAYAPTVSKWVDLYLGARVGKGYCEIYENDVFINQISVASGPDTATNLFPYFLMKDLGTSKVVDMDLFEIITERNTR